MKRFLFSTVQKAVLVLMLMSSHMIAMAQSEHEPSPLYIKVLQNWAQVTNFAINASEVAVDKFVMDLKQDPQIESYITQDLVLDLKQFFYELFISQDTMIALAKVYSEYFSIDELQALIAFYQTPVGKKLVNTRTELTRKTQKVGDELVKENEKEFIELIARHVNKFSRALENRE